MNRNAESRFAIAPSVNIPRTRMDRPFNNTLTWNVGELVPFYYSEVIPGSTHKVRTHKVVRTQPMVSAPMQDLYLDTYYFFVPFRIVWNHWKEFMGENRSSAWVPETEYYVPDLYIEPEDNDDDHVVLGSLLDYLGVPINNVEPGNSLKISQLYTRAYALIVREFFQSENLETPVNVPLDDSNRSACSYLQNTDTYDDPTDGLVRGGAPYIVNKFHDYFTSALPSPVKTANDILSLPNLPVLSTSPFRSAAELTAAYNGVTPTKVRYNTVSNSGTIGSTATDFTVNSNTILFNNLTAINTTTIQDLRVAFALQRLLERDAIGGTRYREVLRAHYGVVSPDNIQDVPMYLGGNRKMLNISQVIQTSETGETPLGNIAGMSLSSDSNFEFESSFTEHGIIMGLQCVRYKHRYSQGIRRCLSRNDRFDFYFPEFARLGSQAIKKKEIFANGSSEDEKVFGYQEYGADYRYNPDMVCGEMRPDAVKGLRSWTFADTYSTHPTLSREWLKEDKTNVDRALAVTSDVANQLWANIEVEETVTLPMPLYSIPSLMSQF